jgi:ABC-type bacteriocin/lantibiotic exporter with double-glycine peptidase domain
MLQWLKAIAHKAYPYGSGQDFWLGILVGSMLIHFLALLLPITIMQIYDHFIPNSDISGLSTMTFVLVMAIVLENILRYAQQSIIGWNDAKQNLQKNLHAFSKLKQIHLHNFTEQHTIKLPDISHYDTSAAIRFSQINCFFVLIYFGFLCYLSTWLSIIPLVAIFLLYGITKIFTTEADDFSTIQNFIYQCLLAGHANLPKLLQRYHKVANPYLINHYHRQIDNLLYTNLVFLIAALTLISEACFGTYLILNNMLTGGMLAAILVTTLQIILFFNRNSLPKAYKNNTKKMFKQLTKRQQATSKALINPHAYARCIRPLLTATKATDIDNALLTSYQDNISIQDIKTLMQQLHYDSISIRLNLHNIDNHLLPGLFVTQDNKVYVLLNKNHGIVSAYDAQSNQAMTLPNDSLTGQFVFFKKQNPGVKQLQKQHWFLSAMQAVKPAFWFSIISTFINSLLILSLPLLIVVLYDYIIRKQAISMLFDFSFGTLIAIVGIVALQHCKAQFFALFKSKLQDNLNHRAFKQFIQIQTSNNELSDYSNELQDLTTVKQFFNSTIPDTLLKLPFIVFAFILLMLFASKLYIIVLLTLLIFVIFALSFKQRISQKIITLQHSELNQQKYTLAVSINNSQADFATFKALASKKIMAHYHLQQSQVRLTTLITIFEMFALVLVLGFGCLEILNGQTSPGALFGCLLLTWMILLPGKQLFYDFVNLIRFKLTWQNLNRLFKLEG